MGTETVERSDLAEAIAERDRILIAFDGDAAKAFVVAHGGTAPKNIKWETVLHLARHECESIKKIHPDLWMDSKIYLARNGTYGVMQMPPNSPYVRTALNLIFPKRLFEAHLARATQDRADGDADTTPEPYHDAQQDAHPATTGDAATDDAAPVLGRLDDAQRDADQLASYRDAAKSAYDNPFNGAV